jgi:hypothetical protein
MEASEKRMSGYPNPSTSDLSGPLFANNATG